MVGCAVQCKYIDMFSRQSRGVAVWHIEAVARRANPHDMAFVVLCPSSTATHVRTPTRGLKAWGATIKHGSGVLGHAVKLGGTLESKLRDVRLTVMNCA